MLKWSASARAGHTLHFIVANQKQFFGVLMINYRQVDVGVEHSFAMAAKQLTLLCCGYSTIPSI
jgi:hypothetical protein